MTICSQHEAVAQGIQVIADLQKEQGIMQSKMLSSIAVLQSTLDDMKSTKALNCEGRIAHLEDMGNGCKDLRAGPRIDKVESRLDKVLWGFVGLIGANTIGALFYFAKGQIK